jgi:hypothetical protein
MEYLPGNRKYAMTGPGGLSSFLLLAQKKRTKEKGSLGFSTTH